MVHGLKKLEVDVLYVNEAHSDDSSLSNGWPSSFAAV